MPTPRLAALLAYEWPVPVRAIGEKQVWIWESLRPWMDTDGMVRFPHQCSEGHRGMTKSKAMKDERRRWNGQGG